MRLLVVFRNPPDPSWPDHRGINQSLVDQLLKSVSSTLVSRKSELIGHVAGANYWEVGLSDYAENLVVIVHVWPTSGHKRLFESLLSKAYIILARGLSLSSVLVSAELLSDLGSTSRSMDTAGPRSHSTQKEWTTAGDSRPVRSDPRPRAANGYTQNLSPDKVRGVIAA